MEKPKSEPPQPLVNVDALLIDTGGRKQSDQGSTSNASLGTQLLLPAPPSASIPSTTTKVDPKIDLLSGDDFSSPTTENVLALVLLVENLRLQVPFHSRMPLLLLTCFHHPATHNLHIQLGRHMLRPLNFDNRVSLLPSHLCTQMEVSPELHTHKVLTWPGTNRYHSNSCSHLLQFMVVNAVLFHHLHGKLRQQRAAKQWGNPHAETMQNNQLLPGHLQAAIDRPRLEDQ